MLSQPFFIVALNKVCFDDQSEGMSCPAMGVAAACIVTLQKN